MYEGCNKTALSSQKNIADSFIKLLRNEEYSKISISEICKQADVSRQTFYTLFESKENIVAFVLAKHYDFQPAHECKCKGTPTLTQLSEAYSKYILSKKEILQLLVKNKIIYMMQCNLYNAFSSCKEMHFDDDVVVNNITADFLAAGLTIIAKHYCLNSDKITEDQLKALIYDLFSGKKFTCGNED
ncbi:MAG: TetR/AcrR family transcriptional regulator [Butyrivibrio sp.]|nr:TetR/AcrR family transcriptional regulator [Butyrivibrio sp.]